MSNIDTKIEEIMERFNEIFCSISYDEDGEAFYEDKFKYENTLPSELKPFIEREIKQFIEEAIKEERERVSKLNR